MHRKIMEALGLGRESHKISIVYRASQLLVNTQVVYNSNPLGCDADVDMMWTVIKWTPQFIVSDLYVTVEVVGFHAGASSQHGNGVKEPHLLPLDVQPSFADATPLAYNTQPCSAVHDLDNTEVLGATQTRDVGGSSYAFEHVQTYMDRRIDIDASRDVYEEFIDTDGPVDEANVLDGPQIKNNEEDCLTTVPIPEWFTLNTWDNINDPSPVLGIGQLTSWRKVDQPAKGTLFQNKASIQYVLTLYFVEHNKQYKVNKSNTSRLVMRCIHEACPWSNQATCSKKHKMWVISTFCAKYNHDAMEFMDRFYHVEEWYHRYEPILQTLKDRLEWPEPVKRRIVISNPRLIQEKGQPKSTRIRNEMDDKDRELPTSLWIENGPKLKCGLCRQEGHNHRRCPTWNVESTSRGGT
nr:hypothetical protein CFP56_74849 [Quercus suber]